MSTTTEASQTLTTRCCVVGGGPAGMMLGLLLARAGVEVVVLEKHADFLRDFRGDTIHPSTLELMHELGWLDAFLARPHQKAHRVTGIIGDTPVTVADFTHLPVQCGFIALMPQWDFLDFLASHAKRYPTFRLAMRAEATGLIEEGGRVVGVRANTPDGPLAVKADLVVGADGRGSTVRAGAGFAVEDIGAPIDVLWMRLSRRPSDGSEPLGRFGRGQVLIMIDRGEYWQCALLIPKGGHEEVKRRGLDALRQAILEAAPNLHDRVHELRSFDDVKLLTVKVDRLTQWARPGLLCIGDAAHAMSPVGGVGVNLAVQDAVATANLLYEPLRRGAPTLEQLQAVQARRMFPTRATQRLQVLVQNRILSRALASTAEPKPPLPLRIVGRFPLLQRIPARVIGMGFRPEHVRTPEAAPAEMSPPLVPLGGGEGPSEAQSAPGRSHHSAR